MPNLEHSCKIKGYHLDVIDCQGQLYAPLKTPLLLFCLRLSQLWINFNSEWRILVSEQCGTSGIVIY